jgi:transcriptional regulator with XRE-family HTH domain
MPEPTRVEELGRAVRTLRNGKELSQEALANRADVHTNQVGRLERGTNVGVNTLLAIAEALGGLEDVARTYEARRAKR